MCERRLVEAHISSTFLKAVFGKAYNLPEGVQLVSFNYNPSKGNYVATFSHASFESVPEEKALPEADWCEWDFLKRSSR